MEKYAAESEEWFQHNKTNGIYRLLGHAQMQINGPLDMAHVVIYQDVGTKRIWVRPSGEFYDGRFSKVPSPSSLA